MQDSRLEQPTLLAKDDGDDSDDALASALRGRICSVVKHNKQHLLPARGHGAWDTMPTLSVTNFNIVLAVLGGWISLFGLVSYLCKETFYLSEARTSSPIPSDWPSSCPDGLASHRAESCTDLFLY